MLNRHLAVILIFSFLVSPNAFAAGPDPLTGVRISLLAVETVLASPPLPDLTENEKGHLTAQGSYITANVNDSEDFGGGVVLASSGTFRGGAFGIGYTTPSRSAWGFYGFATVNEVSGNLGLTETGNPPLTLSGMKNMGYSFAAGASLRLWSARSFPLAIGIFAGPTLSLYSSKFQVDDQNGNNVGGNYTSSPSSLGGMVGAQAGLALGPFYFNPYFIYYDDFSDGCKSFSIDGQTPGGGDPACTEGPNYIKIPLSFGAYGINIGFKNLLLNVYAHVDKDSSLSSIDLHNYQLSYSFDF